MALDTWKTLFISFARLLCVTSEVWKAKFVFERVCPQQYGFEVTRISDLPSVTACSYSCSAVTACRSFLFDPGTGLCQLNAEETTSLQKTCVTSFYGQLEKATCRMSWLYEPCTTDVHCTVPDSYCSDNVCKCQLGYVYQHRTDSCVADFTKYGSRFVLQPGGLKGFDDAAFDNKTTDECKDLCVTETNFVCRAVEAHTGVGRHWCFLTKETKLTQPGSFILALPSQFKTYATYLRNCA